MEDIWMNNRIIHDRIFWIYFMITLFFTIIGVTMIISSNTSNTQTINNSNILLAVLWLFANLALLIVIYHASIIWGPTDNQNNIICVVDSNSGCFNPDNRIWLFINIIFIIILILSLLWAGELSNPDAGPLRTMSGILIILGGLILCRLGLSQNHTDLNSTYYYTYIIPFWVSIIYLLIWFGLTSYVVLNPL